VIYLFSLKINDSDQSYTQPMIAIIVVLQVVIPTHHHLPILGVVRAWMDWFHIA
jgi:hypothetical protein